MPKRLHTTCVPTHVLSLLHPGLPARARPVPTCVLQYSTLLLAARSHSHRAFCRLATTSSPTAVTREPHATSPHDGFLSSASLQWSRSHMRTTHRQLSHHHGNFSSSANSFGSRTLSSQRTSCRAGPFINNTCPHGSIQVYISTHTGKTHVPTCVLLHTSSCSAVTATEPFIALLQLRHSDGQRAAARNQPT